jgi:nucleoside diphosphate kinase 1
MKQKTLIILKPDCVRKKLVGAVIDRFEQAGFEILDMRMEVASYDQLFKHYEVIGNLKTNLEAGGRAHVFAEVMEFMQSGTIVPLLLEREDAIAQARSLAGATRPWEAEKGTIRADFGLLDPDAPIENVIHASANAEEAEQEIALWFPER